MFPQEKGRSHAKPDRVSFRDIYEKEEVAPLSAKPSGAPLHIKGSVFHEVSELPCLCHLSTSPLESRTRSATSPVGHTSAGHSSSGKDRGAEGSQAAEATPVRGATKAADKSADAATDMVT